MIRKTHRTLPAAVVLAALAVVGCEGEDVGTSSTNTGNSNTSSADRSQSAPRSDTGANSSRTTDQQGQLDAQTFVKMAASSGMYEVESSRLALQNASDDHIKQMAQKMIDDHTKANDELKQIAQSKNITVPTEMTDQHRQQLEALQKAQGTNLASMYHQQQLAAHQEAVSLFEKASQQLSDNELKAFAAKTLPTLQEHLKMVQSHQGGAAKPSDAGATPGTPGTPSTPSDTPSGSNSN